MKLTRLTFCIVACFSFLISCSEFEPVDKEQDNVLLKKTSLAPVFLVEPGGGDDTPAIYQAFMDAKDAGPGSVVQLVEGEYHLGFLEVRDFYGSLKGAGKDKTFITVMNNLDAQALFDDNLYHDLVKFIGGDVCLGDFTMRTPPGKLTELPTGHIRGLINFAACNARYELGNENRSINVVIDNVSFKGQYYDEGMGFYYRKYNCMFGIRAGYDCISAIDLPRDNINFKITNSDFDTFCYGLVLEGMKNGTVIVGEKNNGNVFNNLEQSGGVWESRGMHIKLVGNTFNVPMNGWGFDQNDYPYYGLLKEEPENTTTTCYIENNIFNLAHADYALYMRNQRHFLYPGEMPVEYHVKNNLFNMTDYWPWGIVAQVTKDMVISNNKFTGNGYMALYLLLYSQGGLVLGNNYSTAEFDIGAIYLHQSTKDWTVVGGDLTDRVINLGTDNIITGMNVSTSDVSIGSRIPEKIVDNIHPPF